MKIYKEFHSNQKIGKGSKIEGKLEKLTNQPTNVENPRYNLKQLSLRLCNFFLKRNFDTGYKISFVGILDISTYTKSEQSSVAGKHLKRHAKNDNAAVAYIATLLRWPPSFC